MGLRLEIVQYPQVGNPLINGSVIPKGPYKLYDNPEVKLCLVSSSQNEVVHRFPSPLIDYVFVLLALSMSRLAPLHLESDWPPGAVGTNQLEKPGVKVWVSAGSHAVAWVSDKGGLHQLDRENLVYPFEEGMLRVAEVEDRS